MRNAIVCSEDQIQMNRTDLGINVITMFGEEPTPYQIWHADQYRCPICQKEIAGGFAERPYAQHFQEGFEDVLQDVMSQPHVIVFEKVAHVMEAAGGSSE